MNKCQNIRRSVISPLPAFPLVLIPNYGLLASPLPQKHISSPSIKTQFNSERYLFLENGLWVNQTNLMRRERKGGYSKKGME